MSLILNEHMAVVCVYLSISHQISVLLYLFSGAHACRQYLCATQGEGHEQGVWLPSAGLAGDSGVTPTQELDLGDLCGLLPAQDMP